MAAENDGAAQTADESKAAQDTAAAGGDPANAPADGKAAEGADGKGGAGGSEGEGGGASEAVSGGATVAGAAADTTGSVAGAAGFDGVAGGAGIASGAAGTTGGAAQIAGGDVAGGAAGIATGAGGAATGGLGVASASKSASSGSASQAAEGGTSAVASQVGAPSPTGATSDAKGTETTAAGAPGAAKADAQGTVADAKAAPGAAKADAKGQAQQTASDVKGAPGAAKDDAKGKADGAAEDLGIHKHKKHHHDAPDAAAGKAGAGGTTTAAAGGSGAAQAGTGKTAAPDAKAPAAGDTKAPAAGDTKAPAAGDTKAPAGTTAPAGDGKAPAGTTAPAAGDGKAPAGTAPAAGDGKAPAATAPAAGDGKAPAAAPAAGDGKAPAEGTAPAAGDGKAPAAGTAAPAGDGKAPAGTAPAADGKAPAGTAPAAGDGKAPAAADGKGAAGGTDPAAAGGKGADQAAPAAGNANPAQAGANPAQAGANPAQAGANPAQAGGANPAQAAGQDGETRPPIKASPQANQAVESSPAASQDGGGDGKGPERGVPTPMSLGNIKDLAKLLKDGVDQAKPVIADLKDGKIDLSSINKIIDFAKNYDKNANVAALKATIEKITGIAPKALEEGKAFAQDIVKGGVTPETAQKILDAVKTVVPGIEKSDFMQKVQGMTDFATDHSAEIKKFQADVAKDGLAPAAKQAILDYAQKAVPGLVPEKFQAAFKTVVDKYKASGGNIDTAINTLKGLFGKSPEQAKRDVAKALGGALGGALGEQLFKGDKKFLDDIALKLSEATGGKVDANALKQKLDQQLNDIVKNGRDPREMLRLLVTKMGGFVRGLEDLLLQFGIDAKKVLDDVLKALEEFAKKLKEVPEPPKPPKPVRPPVDLFAASAAERYDYFKEVVTDVAKGKWEDADKQINVIGVRNFREWREVKEEDFFWNDSVVVLWKEGGKKRAEGFLASVDPARRQTEQPVAPTGAAHLVDGHYKYKKIEVGLGANKKMFAMPDSEIKFWRDRNRDAERDEEEHIEKGRTQIWLMPGGVQLTGDDFSSGAQVIAGGEKGAPWRRFLEVLKADANGSFAYTLVDSARLPAYRPKTLYLPLAAGAKKVPLKPFDPQLGARFNGMYKHVELGEQGGYYPFGLARSWHGGIHALAPQGQDTVVSVASGEVVAARLGAIDAAKHKNGSANFVLVRHKHEKPDAKEGEKPAHWFSLYYHLQPVTDASLPWVWKIEQEAKKEEEKAAEKKKQQAGQEAGQAAGQAVGQNAGQAAPGAKEVDVAEEKEVKHEKKGKVPAGKLAVTDGVPKEALVETKAPPPPPPAPTTEKKLLAEKDVAVPKPAPNVKLAPAKIEWDVETAGMLKGALFLKKLEPQRHFEASLSGAFWSYSDFTKGGASKQGNNGAFGIHKLAVDANNVIDVELGGGVGVYTVDYYMNGSKLGYHVATCGPSAVSLALTDQAKGAGWTQAGHKLTPPKAVLEQPFPPVQLAAVKASFDVLVDGAKTFSFGAVGLNHVEHVDLGPVAKGNKKLAIQMVPGSGDVGKFGFEAQVEVSKAPQQQGGAGQDAGQKPQEQKPQRLEWDVDTEGALKLDVKLATLEHVELETIDRILFPSTGHVSYKPHAEAAKPAPAQAGPGQAQIIGGPVNGGFAFATLKKGYPGAVPLQVIGGLGFPHFTADEADVRASGQKGGTIEAHLGFIFPDQRPGTRALVRMKNARGIEMLTTSPETAQGFSKDKTLGFAYDAVKVDATAGVKVFVDGAEKKVETPKLTAGKAWGAFVDLGAQKPGAHKVAVELDAGGMAIEKWGVAPKFETQPKAPEEPRKDLAYEGQVNSSKSLRVKVTSNDPDKGVKVQVLVDDMTKKEIVVEKKGETAEADLGDLPGAHKLTLVPQALEGSLGESWKADLVIVTTRKATAEEAALMDNEFAFLVTRGQGGKFEKDFDSKGKVKVKVDFETAGGVKIDLGVGANKFAAGSPKGGDKLDKDLGRVAAGAAKLTIEGKAGDDFGKEPPKDWKPVIKAGAKFKVMLNAVDVKPNNPAEWGTIKPGSGYVLKYNKATGFEAFGFNLGTNALGTWTYAGADPDKGEITIWGHKFKFDAAGNVTDPKLTKLGQVGKLELLEVPVKGKVTITTEELAPKKEPEDDKKKDEKGPASKSKEALDKAKDGKVGIFEPGAVKIAGGARLGVGSVYGSPGKKKKMIHFEVFSPGGDKPVFDPKADKMGWEYVEDTDANATVDVEKLLKAIDLDKDGTITATEVKAAYGGKGVGPKLRAYVVKHTSEWFVDWKSVLPNSEFWKKMLKDDELKEAANLAQELTWWDGGLSKWEMKDKLVVNYHPFRFLQWLLQEQKAAAEASPYHFPAGAAWKLSKLDYEKQFNPPKDGGDGKGGDVHQGPAQGGEDPTAGGDGKGGDQSPAQGGGNAGGGNNPAQAGGGEGGGANPGQAGGGGANPGQAGGEAPAGGADGKGGAGGAGGAGDAGAEGGAGGGTNPSDGKGGGDTGASPAGGDGKGGDGGTGTDSGSGAGDTGSGAGGETGSGKGDTGSESGSGAGDPGSGKGDTSGTGTTGKGDTGATGATGKGDTGATGKGDTGAGTTGKGDTSSSGGTGASDGKGGAGGTTSGSSGGSGAGGAGSTGKGDTSSGSTGGGTTGGTTGTGDTSSSGSTGGAGSTGTTGKGDTGSTGAGTTGKGDTGSTGSAGGGATGKGDAGSTGSTSSGTTGKGDTGSTGSTGSGTTGKGDTSSSGSTGGTGATGKGDTGSTGSTGTTGKGGTTSSSGSGATTGDGKGGAGGTTSGSSGGSGAPATSDGKGGTTATTADGKGGTTATTADGKGAGTSTTTGTGTTSTGTTSTSTTSSGGTTGTSSSSSSSGGSSGGGDSGSGVDAAGMISAGSTGAGSIIGAVGTAAGSGEGGGKGGEGGEEEGAKGGEGGGEEELGTDESKEAGGDEESPEGGENTPPEGASTDEKESA